MTGGIAEVADTRYKTRPGEFPGDLQTWLRENAGDNSDRLERLKRNLRRAQAQELTPRQRQILTMRYEEQRSVTEIARALGVNPSTVTRSLQRSRQRLFRCLRYGL